MTGKTVPKVFGARSMGELHTKLKTPCQDGFARKVLPSGLVVIAVADGLGSASKSEHGSKTAVDTAVEQYAAIAARSPKAHFDENAKKTFEACREAIKKKAQELGSEPRDLATTMILVVSDERGLWAAHIGDGAVVARVSGCLEIVSSPGESEYANEVTPLTSGAWEAAVRYDGPFPGAQEAAAFTDGCQRAAFSRKDAVMAAHDKFFNPLFNFAQKLEGTEKGREEGDKEIEQLLGSPKICEHSDDDKTLVIAVLGPKHEGNPIPLAARPQTRGGVPPAPSAPAAAKPASSGPRAAAGPTSPPPARPSPAPSPGRPDPASPETIAPFKWIVGVLAVLGLAAIIAFATHWYSKLNNPQPTPRPEESASAAGPPPAEGHEFDLPPEVKKGSWVVAVPPMPLGPGTKTTQPEAKKPDDPSNPEADFPEAWTAGGITSKRFLLRGIELENRGRMISAYAAYLAAEKMDKDNKEAGERKVSLNKGFSTEQLRDALKLYDQAIEPLVRKAPKWVKLPGGSFKMGSGDGEPAEQPPHKVTVPAFYLSKTEVTVEQYKMCADAGECLRPDKGNFCNWDVPGRSAHPVNCVSWDQAKAYCHWAVGRLPTEAEWEYAARSAGKAVLYPWGDNIPTCKRAVMVDGGQGCGKSSTWPVCSKTEGNTEQGLCDMAGNVLEWTQDSHHTSYKIEKEAKVEGAPPLVKTAPANGSAWEDPPDPQRVIRGGSWVDSVLRAAKRWELSPDDRNHYTGFRCARSAAD